MRRSTKSQVEETPKMVVGLDIGTTKIMMVMGYLRHDGKIEVCGYGKAPSTGVEFGRVVNVQDTINGIMAARDMLKANMDEPVSEVYVGVAGRHVKSTIYRNSILRPNGLEKMVSEEEIEEMKDQMEQYSIPGCDVIAVIPQNYDVDGHSTLRPVGTLGQKVIATYQLITGDQNEVKRIKFSVDGADLELKNLMLEPIASGLACLTEEEKQQGVALVDIGGGTTDLIIFESGVPLYIKVIPIGGQIVTRDIQTLGLSYEQAETLKIKHGTCFVNNADKNNFITIPDSSGYGNPLRINEYTLAQVINARVARDILEPIKHEIEVSGYGDKVRRIVLTGGGSMMRDIQNLSEFIIQRKTRIGIPTCGINNSVDAALKEPICSTALGLLKVGCVTEATPYKPVYRSMEEEPKKPSATNKNTQKKGNSKVEVNMSAFYEGVVKWLKSVSCAGPGPE